MVFLTKGMHFDLPAIEFTMDDDGNTSSRMLGPMKTAIERWPMWLDLAFDSVLDAQRARERVELTFEQDNEACALALYDECRFGMAAIAASAFALDAYYGSTRMRVSLPPTVENAWQRNRTKRSARIHQTYARSFHLDNDASRQIHDVVRDIFSLRDDSVHASPETTMPAMHPVVSVTDARFANFRVENAHKASKGAYDIVWYLTQRPRKKFDALVAWTEMITEKHLPAPTARWKNTVGLGAVQED